MYGLNGISDKVRFWILRAGSNVLEGYQGGQILDVEHDALEIERLLLSLVQLTR
jgi:hypothetical protein